MSVLQQGKQTGQSRYKRGSIIFVLTSFLLIFLSCEVPMESYDNPLDVDAAEEGGMETPALVFFPDEINVNAGETFTVSVYALNVDDVAGAYINIGYDRNKLLLMTVNPGTFFSDLQDPIYFSETQNSGKIELYTVFLGADSSSVSGTGSFMSIVFSASASGTSTLSYSTDSELVDADDNPIEIKGFGEGVVNAQ
ncbi:MAG: hypothetical protein IIB95_02450 [Candidatus Marinimicrobia bacterium]|nr:hypothetical protein [Candidatus Neomarinimicrobiota bacterium]